MTNIEQVKSFSLLCRALPNSSLLPSLISEIKNVTAVSPQPLQHVSVSVRGEQDLPRLPCLNRSLAETDPRPLLVLQP